jgi:K+-sensing histidine kinase KdpD
MDTGIGIKKKNKKKLFKLFGSIKDEKKQINTKGIGLGLVISKLIISKFNGFIDFVSKYKKGSTFFYTIEVENFDFETYKLAQVSKIKE